MDDIRADHREAIKLYMAELKIFQLSEHIKSGAPTSFRVYAGNDLSQFQDTDSSSGPFATWQEAKAAFDAYSEYKWARIALDTRIGTQCVMLERGVRNGQTP